MSTAGYTRVAEQVKLLPRFPRYMYQCTMYTLIRERKLCQVVMYKYHHGKGRYAQSQVIGIGWGM